VPNRRLRIESYDVFQVMDGFLNGARVMSRYART
jgi:hypothetical protein